MSMRKSIELGRSLKGETIERVEFTVSEAPYIDIEVWDIILTLSDGRIVAFTPRTTSLQTLQEVNRTDLDGEYVRVIE